jgi:hypothetical protein
MAGGIWMGREGGLAFPIGVILFLNFAQRGLELAVKGTSLQKQPVFRIRMAFIRIRIQQFSWMRFRIRLLVWKRIQAWIQVKR